MSQLNPKLLTKIILAIIIPVIFFSFSPKQSSSATDGLVAEWKFDENGGIIAPDSSGNGNNGTLVNGPVWTAGKVGGALQFDGVNDYVDAGNGAGLNITGAITVSTWIKTLSKTNYPAIVHQSDGYSAGYALRIEAGNGGIDWQIKTNTAQYRIYSGLKIPLDDTWTQVVGVYDGTQITTYLNGVYSASKVASGNIISSGSTQIASRASTWSAYFSGSVDEVKIYNRALSAQEILADYNAVNNLFDTTPPIISISSPSNNAALSNSSLAVTGIASDNVALSKVEVKLNSGPFITATGTTSWSIPLTLVSGINTITARATDTSNYTQETFITVTYTPATGQWESLHLNGGGYITSLAIDPKSPNIIYAGNDVGGILKSTDYGDTWRIINKGLRDDADYSIVAIAIHPQNSNVIYIATGMAWGHPTGNYGGIYKSIDGGENWQLVTNQVKFSTWSDKKQNGGDVLAFSAIDPNIMYAVSDYAGIFKSIDGGDTWTTLRSDLNADGLVINVLNSDILYVVSFTDGVYKSIDGGITWVAKNNGLNFTPTVSNPYIGQYVTIALDPTNPNILYAASKGYRELYKSNNSGENWINLYNPDNIYLDGWWGPKSWFAMHTNCIAINPQNSSQVYIGDWHKVWRTDDQGYTWHIKPWGLETTVLPTVAIDPRSSEKIWVGAMDVGLFKSVDFGQTFQRSGFGNVWDIAFDSSTNPSTIFIAEGSWGGSSPHPGGIHKSVDEGTNWTEISSGMPNLRVLQIEINPKNSQIMYAGLEKGVGVKTGIYKSIDGGANWSQKSNGLPEDIEVGSIIVNSNNTNIVYIRDRAYGIFKSIDGGENWNSKNSGINKVGSPAIYRLNSLAIDSNNPDILYAGGNWYGVYKSIDGGESWQNIFGNFRCMSVSVDTDSNIYIAGSPQWFDPETRLRGIFRSKDGGQNWENIYTDGLVSSAIKQITIDPHNKNRIYLASGGNGLFRGTEETIVPSDTTLPAISISSPTNNQAFTNPSITVSGTASDDIALSKVEVKLNSGSYQTATGTTSWSLPLTLTSGSNTITAKATDTSNNIKETSITVTYTSPDTTPPSAITNLSSSNITQTSANLIWTSAGDDGNTGTASSYDIRYSTQTITEANWSQTTQVTGEPNPQIAGTAQSQYISVGLTPNTTYFFAIKSQDEVPNISALSNILQIKTLATTVTPPPAAGGGIYSDTTPPAKPSDFKLTPAEKQITLSWKNPTDSDFIRVLIIRKENSAPTSQTDGTVIYEGVNQTYTDTNLDNTKTYFYSIFAYDAKPNYSQILSLSSQPQAGVDSTSTIAPTYSDSTLLKTQDSPKVYVIMEGKKKWISTPEVFETLCYKWTNITIIDKTNLDKIPDSEDNLIRAINDYKVYLVVNGISRHIPNPEIFLNYGFAWEDVVDVPQETIDKYQRAYLVRESRQGTIYYLRADGVKKWIKNPEIFNSYNNKWEDVQVISKPEMEAYPESNLIQLAGDYRTYLIEGNTKRHIPSTDIFGKYGYDWEHIITVNRMEFDWYGEGNSL